MSRSNSAGKLLLPNLHFTLPVAFFASIVLSVQSSGQAPRPATPNCQLRIELIDTATGKPTPGLVQIRTSDGKLVRVPELLNRGQGLNADLDIHGWQVITKPTVIRLPQGRIVVRGFAGLETKITEVELDLLEHREYSCKVELERFFSARDEGWQAANTHVHLKNTTRPETDRYLVECSQGDELDVVFVSYLERPSEHVHYSTNAYTREELHAMSNSHTHFDHGEEHRHNFTPWEEGYGHVMLLNIPELIMPVSIGPGITEEGTDGTPLRVGIEKARDVGGRIIWCHNAWGLENVPSWLAGNLDANNIFDGGTHGSYQHSFYRYLNIGLHVPFSTGTDWFMYDFSRVYVKNADRLTPEQWLDELAQGHSYITNGPLLEFTVNGNSMGQHFSIDQPGEVRVQAHGRGRVDFQRLELIMNGEVIKSSDTVETSGYFDSRMDFKLPISSPAWLALRTPPPSAPDKGLMKKTPLNEYGRELFSHSSAIFVDVAGRRRFDQQTSADLLDELRRNRELVRTKAKFSDAAERQQVLDIYDQAVVTLSELQDER